MRKIALAAFAVLGIALCASTARAGEVDNPEYKAWSKFNPGSYVVMKMTNETAGNKMEITTTTTLVEKTADKLVLEDKTSMVIGGNKIDNPGQKRDVPAKVKVEGTSEQKSDAKVTEGKESIELGGKKVDCKVVEVQAETNGTKSHTKTWSSDEIPGGTAKQEVHSEGAMKSTMTRVADKWEAK